LIGCGEDVKDEIGYALFIAQQGGTHSDAKPLQGFGGANVFEIVADSGGNTYRGLYTVRFSNVIYVLHVFMKKSKTGRKTPKSEIDLIKSRLKTAQDHYRQHYGETTHG
jgi:phage-related protein